MSVAPRHQEEQRGRILQAAATLIAATGYHGMSMRGLAKASGISLANLYNYFSSKDEILFAIQKQAFERLIAATTEVLATITDAGEALYVFIFHHVRYFAEHPDVMRVLVHQAASLPAPERRALRRLKQRYFEIGRRLVSELIASRGGSPADDPAELERVTYCLFGMLNWIHGWYRPQEHGSPRELAHTIHGVALGGMARGPQPQLQEHTEALVAALQSLPLLGRIAVEETTP